MKKLKIGLVSRFPPQKDGIGIYSLSLALKLKESIDVVTIGTKNSDSDYLLNFNSFTLKNDIKKIATKENLDLIHFQYIPPFYSKFLNINFLSALKQNLPVIVTFHEVYYKCSNFKEKVLSYIQKLIIKLSNKVIVHTSNQQKFLENKFNQKNICSILMGLTPLKINRDPGKNLLFFGFISPGKGINYLIDAMKYLPEYNLIIRGKPVNSKISDELKNQAKDINNIDIKFGWVSSQEKKDIYKKANMVILPYIWGPYQSAVVTDALSQRLPVVISKVGAVYEITKLSNTGEVIEPKNPKQITDAIKKINNNYNNYLVNIDKYQKKANWKQIAKNHINEYSKLIN